MRVALFALVFGSLLSFVQTAQAQRSPEPLSLSMPRELRVDPLGYELALTRNQQPSLFWPIVVSGAGVLTLGGSAAMIGLALAIEAKWGPDGSVREQARELGPLYAAAGVGAAITAAGVTWLVRTALRRRPYARRIRELEQQRLESVSGRW